MTMPSLPSLSADERELAQLLGRLDPARQPSVALDASVLALARQSAASQQASRSTPPRLRRWPAAVGLAASLLLAVGIAWQLRPTPDFDGTSEAPAAASAPEQAAGGPWLDEMADTAAPAAPEAFPSMEAPAEPAAPAPIIPASSRDSEAVAVQTEPQRERSASAAAASEAAPPLAMKPEMIELPAPVAAPAPPPPPAPMADAAAPAEAAADASAPAARNQRSLDHIVVSGSRLPAPPTEATAKNAATAAASAPADAAATAANTDRDYDTAGFSIEAIDEQPPANADAPLVQKAWLNRIRALLARGEITAAQYSLGEFRRRYPQYPLPDDLQRLVPPPASTP